VTEAEQNGDPYNGTVEGRRESDGVDEREADNA
jgi:hypothetical protein